jgi:hypothetical protein
MQWLLLFMRITHTATTLRALCITGWSLFTDALSAASKSCVTRCATQDSQVGMPAQHGHQAGAGKGRLQQQWLWQGLPQERLWL